MWSTFAEKLLELISVALASFLSYKAGGNAVKSDQKDEALSDVETSNKADAEILASHADPDWRKRMRQQFTIKPK